MTFGLYTIPTSDLVFRKMDGIWTAHNAFSSNDHKANWKYYSTDKGRHVDARVLENHANRMCLTFTRSISKVLYGVPDDVELYAEDAQNIQK